MSVISTPALLSPASWAVQVVGSFCSVFIQHINGFRDLPGEVSVSFTHPSLNPYSAEGGGEGERGEGILMIPASHDTFSRMELLKSVLHIITV